MLNYGFSPAGSQAGEGHQDTHYVTGLWLPVVAERFLPIGLMQLEMLEVGRKALRPYKTFSSA